MSKAKTVVTTISKISERPSAKNAALVVIWGTDLGRKHELVKSVTTIGRSARCDIQVDQESVSRNHAEILHDGKRAIIHDRESTNGTFVNDDPIRETGKLRNGDFVKIGRTVFKFIAGGNIEAQYHDEIYRLTTVDGLTQVFNKRYFAESLEREVSRSHRYGRPLSLVMLDIDLFKKVNDVHGHLAGDAILKQLASLIRTKIRREDIFARYGGEEFAIILPELELKSALVAAEKVRRLVEKAKFDFDEEPIRVTVSAGVAAITKEAHEAQELVRAADAKLYEAKREGRNRVCG